MFENAFTRRRLLLSAAMLSGGAMCVPTAWSRGTRGGATATQGPLSIAILDGARWIVKFAGKTVIHPSALGFVRTDGKQIGPGAVLMHVASRKFVGSWQPTYGIAARYDETFGEVTASFLDASGVAFDVVVRAYEIGVALRYVLRTVPGGEALHFSDENTHFVFPKGSRAVASRDEGAYGFSAVGDLAPQADPPATHDGDAAGMADIPVTVLLADGTIVSVAESCRLAYPRLMLRADGPDTLVSHTMRYPARRLGPSAETLEAPVAPEFVLSQGDATPWRVLTIAAKPERLIETVGLVPTLAGPCALADTSWIRPGKAVRIRLPYTNERALKVVAFAKARKLDYIEFDWHWYGNGTDDADATVPIAGLDIRRVIDEAKAAGIGTILYVDRAPLAKQLDAIVRTYESWGVAGIKFGFVWEGGQADNAAIVKAIRTCGEHHLLADLHDDMRPAGLERIFPNYINLEGVRGNEHFPTARHNVTLPYTRNLAGPIDYTICYANAKNRTTNAHQLAMAAVYYSPLNFLYWYDEPEKYETGDWSALKWFDDIPTVWDETRGLAGAIGEYAAVARRRGQHWFLGVMTNESARTLQLPLSFLGTGRWQATIYADGVPTDPAYKTEVVIARRIVGPQDILTVAMNASGGQAVSFEPVL